MPNINFSENNHTLEIVFQRVHFVAEGTIVNVSSSDTYIKYINQTTIAL